MSYFRAIDPLPLVSAEHNKLHAAYEHLAAGRLATTRCRGCGRRDWPPRGFCPECGGDEVDWVELPGEGTVHAFTVQHAGVPAGFAAPLILAVVKVGELRVFAPIIGERPGRVAIGARVRLHPVRVADEPGGAPRHLPAFALVEPAG
jgi:uncharacterized OB-fold protein